MLLNARFVENCYRGCTEPMYTFTFLTGDLANLGFLVFKMSKSKNIESCYRDF